MAEAPEGVVQALKEAVAAIEEARVPKDLREIAFKAALGSQLQAAPTGDPPSGATASPARPQPLDGSNPLEKIAQALDLDVAKVGLVLDVDDEEVAITVGRNRLHATAKGAQQEVTYLVVAARQAAGFEDWTPVKTVIEATHDRGVHDSNVSKAISALDGRGIRFKGSKGSRELKMNAVGFAKAADIVKRLTEDQ